MDSPYISRILSRLDNIRPSGEGWIARCPAHDDAHASLSVGAGDDGRVLLYCHAGCEVANVVAALDLTMADLFPDPPSGGRGEGALSPHKGPQTRNASPAMNNLGCTLAQYAAAKGVTEESLRGLGLTDMAYLGVPAVRIPYFGPDGTLVATRFRRALSGDERFVWKKGDKPVPYGLWKLAMVRELGYALLVEGESDAHTCWLHGVPALGIPGAGMWREPWAEYLDGVETIYLIEEPDKGGETFARKFATSRLRDRIRLVRLAGAKDPSDLHLADADRFTGRLREALDTAEPLTRALVREARDVTSAAARRASDLIAAPDILARFWSDVRAAGLVGEERVAKLLFLAVVSRHLDRPVNVAVKGPSSGGKSHTVEHVLRFFPADAYYPLSAMSERALAYSEEPLAHRFLVLYEAAGMAGDFATYLLRSLLSEGKVRYETVEKTKDGLRPRLIERAGPTGLIVTTTATRLHPENETRLFSVTVQDTPAQTAAVLVAIADERGRAVAYAPWHALATWLAGQGGRVTVPYADVLARAIPPVAVRLRRDFGAVLTLIRAHALLHQASRERDAEGRIVATLGDYRAVRDLVAGLVAEAAEATVPPAVRETVGALRGLGRDVATVTEIAGRLNLDSGTASRRVRAAVERGYLTNLEERKGKPARIVLDQPLPEDHPILPEPDTLCEAKHCAIVVEREGIDVLSPTGTDEAEEEEGAWVRAVWGREAVDDGR